MSKYRYLTLKCKAKRETENGLIKVTILDNSVNPLQRGLYFDEPLDSLRIVTPGTDGDEIEMVAAFDEEWFRYHSQVEMFSFKNATTGLAITDFIQLDPPKMDPVKPPQ